MSRVKVYSKSDDPMAFWDDQLKRFAQTIAQESFSSKLNETQDTIRQLDTKLVGISKVVKLQHELSENQENQYNETISRLRHLEEKSERFGAVEGKLENLEKKIDSYLASNSAACVETRLQAIESRLGDAVGARYLAKELESTEDKLVRLINDCQESSEKRESLLMNKIFDAFRNLQDRVDELSVKSYRERPKSVRSSTDRSLEFSRPGTHTSFYDAKISPNESKSIKGVSPIKPVFSKIGGSTRHRDLEKKIVCDIFPSSEGRASRTESQGSRKSPISELAETNRRGTTGSVKAQSSQGKSKKRVVKRKVKKPPTPKFANKVRPKSFK
mmetsp:Transcript_4559/g.8721  ORF Transcript_4559/g.8721 Transcript_4559/m.8721 type:complete len:329 (-) Transcript_4559:108-1094(-)